MNSRDWATVFWAGVLLAILLLNKAPRVSLSPVFRALASLKLLVPLGLLAGYIILLLYRLWRLDLWNLSLLRDTIYWFVLTGLVMFGGLPKVSTPGYFRRLLTKELGVALFLSFYLDLYTFHVVFEIVIQFLLFFALVVEALAGSDPNAARLKPLASGCLSLAGFGFFVAVAVQIVRRWPEVLEFDTLEELLLPVWLTLGSIPLIFLLGLWVAYNTAFVHIRVRPAGRWPKWRTRLALISVGWLRPTRVGAVVPWRLYQAIEATSLREARQVLRLPRPQFDDTEEEQL